MAFESRFWRTQIKRDISYILKRLDVKTNNLSDEKLDQLFSEVEIKFFTITYSLRKLMDTKKFPDDVANHPISCSKYRRNMKKHLKPWSLFDDYYHLEDNTNISLSLREICNQFTHAHFFQPVTNAKNNLGTIFFVSDRDKDRVIYSINIKHLLKQIIKITDKYPSSVSYTFDEKNGDWNITAE